MNQSFTDAAEQGSIAALYQSLRDLAVQGNIDALYQSLKDAAEQGSIDALYQSLKDAAVQGSIDALYQSLRAAEQGRIDVLYQSLEDAAERGNIDDLYALIRRNANVLDSMDKIPIVETPLHIAASLGHTQFAMEIMKLKPSFAWKLNQDGFSPMHLALRRLHDSQNDALKRNLTQLVHQLLDVEKDLVRVKGKGGVTPLHYVVQIENLYFLVKFVKACPKSIEDVTSRGQNVLHIALKYDRVEAFWHLIQYLRRVWIKDGNLLMEKLLYWQDDEGNTLLPVDDEGNNLLHIAAYGNQLKVMSWLLDRSFVDVNDKNFEGKTAFDILGSQTRVDNQLIRCTLILRRQRSVRCLIYIILFPCSIVGNIMEFIRRQQRTITEERRNALLVVAALLLTVTYQVALGPEQPNQFNCTAPINVTGANQFNCTARFNANSTELNSYTSIAFYAINTLTYYLTNVTLLFLLPPDFIAVLLYYLLGLLFLCYCISTPLLNVPLVSTVGICLLPSFPIFGLLSTSRLSFHRSLIKYIWPYFFLGLLSLAAVFARFRRNQFLSVCARITATGAKSGFLCHFVKSWVDSEA